MPHRRVATGESCAMQALHSDTRDEMGVLAYWFNQRTERLASALRELEAIKEGIAGSV